MLVVMMHAEEDTPTTGPTCREVAVCTQQSNDVHKGTVLPSKRLRLLEESKSAKHPNHHSLTKLGLSFHSFPFSLQ